MVRIGGGKGDACKHCSIGDYPRCASGIPAFPMADPAKLNQGTDIGDERGRFLIQFIKTWRKGRACPLGNNPGYVYSYAVGLILDGVVNNSTVRWREHAAELNRLSVTYSYLYDVERDVGIWSSDCYAIVSDYRKAVSSFPFGYFEHLLQEADFHWGGGPDSPRWVANRLLMLKRYAGLEVSPKELLVLASGKGLTDYGIANLDRVMAATHNILAERQTDMGMTFLDKYANPWGDSYIAFPRCYYKYEVQHLRRVTFVHVNALDFCKVTFKRAENCVREEDGLPLMGTGISYGEAKLLGEMRAWLGNENVRSEVNFDWLSFQHIDVFLPSLQVGIEFQGPQHFRPVDYFGGEEGFQKTLERDARKKALCEQNGLTLIYVDERYDLEKLKKEILARTSGHS